MVWSTRIGFSQQKWYIDQIDKRLMFINKWKKSFVNYYLCSCWSKMRSAVYHSSFFLKKSMQNYLIFNLEYKIYRNFPNPSAYSVDLMESTSFFAHRVIQYYVLFLSCWSAIWAHRYSICFKEIEHRDNLRTASSTQWPNWGPWAVE